MTRLTTALTALAAIAIAAGCAGAKRPMQATAPVPGATLWEQPSNLTSRDLFHGPWGASHAPDPAGTYTLVEVKRTGVNPGMTVKDAQGREWSVKQNYPGGVDPEGPVEVVVSRLLSAIGYHQPAVYYLPAFYLKDDWGTHVEIGGRFRLKDDTLVETGSWAWEENPFVGSRPYQGLLAFMMMINATDLKASNNSLYERKRGDLVEQWYVARDVGSALGDTERFAPRKGHVETFEKAPFILGVSNGHVEFAYSGWYKDLVRNRIKPEEVAWVSNLLAQLTDKQWQDAFRAGGYDRATATRFIRAMRAKVAQGQKIGGRVADER